MNPTKGFVVYPKRDPDAQLRLICLAHAGAGVAPFYKWAAHVDRDVELVAIRLPGRESRLSEAPFTDLTLLLDDLCPAILPVLDKPYALVGHCSGALIAFELARRLRRLDAPDPLCLYVAGRPAPDVRYSDPLISVKSVGREAISDEALAASLASLEGTPPELLHNPEFLAMVLPAVRADLELCAAYTYVSDVPFSFPTIAMRGEQDQFLSSEDLESWRKHTRAAFSVRTFAGGHFFVYDNPSVVRCITRELVARGQANA